MTPKVAFGMTLVEMIITVENGCDQPTIEIMTAEVERRIVKRTNAGKPLPSRYLKTLSLLQERV
jgi:hypothetical protein